MPSAATGDTPKLLSDLGSDDVVTAPFAHLVRHEAISAPMYTELASGFPALATLVRGQGDVGPNVAVRMTAHAVLAESAVSPVWRSFFRHHISLAHWRDVVRVFGEHFRRAFPDLEERVGRPFDAWRVVPRGSDGEGEVRLDCQFVMNTPAAEKSSVKPPHVDRYDKIFSALLYMRDESDRADGGDLDLYRWRRKPRFVKHRTLVGDVERVQTVSYAPNTYVAFVNSPRSVHGVSPRDPTSVPRRYVNFIAEIPLKAFTPRQVSRVSRWWHRPQLRAALDEREY
jgi:hypothetical protein